jgi:hypothetical protein
MNIKYDRLEQLIIVVIVDILKALSKSFFDEVACLPYCGSVARGSLGLRLSRRAPRGPQRLSQQKSAAMIEWPLRLKAQRNKRRLHRVGRRLIAITLAWLLLAGGAAAQNPAPPNPDLSARGSDTAHLRGGWYPWDPSVPRLQAGRSNPDRL